MNLVIDIRALMQPGMSGVHVYVRTMVQHIIQQTNPTDTIILFSNSRSGSTPWQGPLPHNVQTLHTHIPNRLFSIAQSLGLFPIDSIVRHQTGIRADIVWIPDPRPTAKPDTAKLVTTFHDLSPFRYPQNFSTKTRLFHKLTRQKHLAHISDRIIAVTDFTQNELQSLWRIPTDKITRIYEAADPAMPLTKETTQSLLDSLGVRTPFFLTLSTLEPRKNLDKLTRLWQKHCAQHTLVVAGTTTSLFSQTTLQQSPNIQYVGRVTEQQKAALYTACEGLLYASVYEGFGLQIVEASAYGKSVCYNTQARVFAEVAGGMGYPFDGTDDTTFAQGLIEYTQNPDLRASLEKEAMTNYNRFSWSSAASSFLSLCSSLFPKNETK